MQQIAESISPKKREIYNRLAHGVMVNCVESQSNPPRVKTCENIIYGKNGKGGGSDAERVYVVDTNVVAPPEHKGERVFVIAGYGQHEKDGMKILSVFGASKKTGGI